MTKEGKKGLATIVYCYVNFVVLFIFIKEENQ